MLDQFNCSCFLKSFSLAEEHNDAQGETLEAQLGNRLREKGWGNHTPLCSPKKEGRDGKSKQNKTKQKSMSPEVHGA
jgi:hypothetical protein